MSAPATVPRNVPPAPLERPLDNPADNTLVARVQAVANCCIEYIRALPQTLWQAYESLRMLIRAFNSMGGETNGEVIDKRVEQLTAFCTALRPSAQEAGAGAAPAAGDAQEGRRLLDEPLDRRGAASDEEIAYILEQAQAYVTAVTALYEAIDLEVRECFFDVDATYIQSFLETVNRETLVAIENGPEAGNILLVEQMRDKILRQCEQVISFQQNLQCVNAWYCHFMGRDAYSSSFVVYIKEAIPPAVQAAAEEIVILRELYQGLRQDQRASHTFPPDAVSTEDFIALPVFDGTHPAIKRRIDRHHLESTTMETIFGLTDDGVRQDGDQGFLPPTCPTCRHPTQRGNLRIDVNLQQEILTFLREAVPKELQQRAGVPQADARAFLQPSRMR